MLPLPSARRVRSSITSRSCIVSSVSRRWRGSDAVPPRDGALRRADRGASGFAALRHLDGAIRSITPPRRRDTRLPEPRSWKTDAAIAPVASVAAFLIFTTRACGADWRQALAGSTLRSSAWGRRGPVRSRGTVAEVCPRSGSIRSRSSTHPAERQASQRARAAGVAAVASERPCLQHSRRRRVSLPRTAPASSGSYQCQCLGQPKEHIRPHAIDASSRRAVA